MWHASIDNLESCESITASLNELEERTLGFYYCRPQGV